MGLDINSTFETEPAFGASESLDPAADVGSAEDGTFGAIVSSIIPDEVAKNLPWNEYFDTRMADIVAQGQGTIIDNGP